MSFRKGDVGSNHARIDPEMSLKDKWPRGDSLDGHQLDLLLKALEMENLSHHDPPRPPTSNHDGLSSRSPGADARHNTSVKTDKLNITFNFRFHMYDFFKL